jgi:ubiquinone/menaquinone biosynthesis C-methylase UbiE
MPFKVTFPIKLRNTVSEKFSYLSHAELEKALLEFEKFCHIASVNERLFLPCSKLIDEIWHSCILETKVYAEYCKELPTGKFIHHTGISFEEYSRYKTPQELLEDDLSLFATYVENFGNFTECTIVYWPVAMNFAQKQKFTIDEFNFFCHQIIAKGSFFTEKQQKSPEKKLSQKPFEIFNRARTNKSQRRFELLETMQNRDGANSYEMLSEKLELLHPSTVLDLGCGEATLLKYLNTKCKSASYIGIDFADKAIELAKQKHPGSQISFKVCEANDTGISSGTIDVVVANMVVHMLNDIENIFTEVSRVMKPHGTFLCFTPAPWRFEDRETFMLYFEMQTLLRQNSPKKESVGLGNSVMNSFSSIQKLANKIFGAEATIEEGDTEFSFQGRASEILQYFTTSLADFSLVPKNEKARVLNLLYEKLLEFSDENTDLIIERPMCLIAIKKCGL